MSLENYHKNNPHLLMEDDSPSDEKPLQSIHPGRQNQREEMQQRLEEEKAKYDKSLSIKYVLDNLYQEHFELGISETGLTPENLDEESRSQIEYELARPFYNQLNDYLKDFKAAHRKYLKKRDQWYPTKWMLDDPLISRLLEKYTKIPDILNALEPIVKKQKEAEMFSLEGHRYKNDEGKIYSYAAFMTDNNFYKEISPALGLSENAIRQYLRAFVDTGVIKLLYKAGTNKNIPVYALGYYSDWKDKPRLNRFLTIKMKAEFKKFMVFNKNSFSD